MKTKTVTITFSGCMNCPFMIFYPCNPRYCSKTKSVDKNKNCREISNQFIIPPWCPLP